MVRDELGQDGRCGGGPRRAARSRRDLCLRQKTHPLPLGGRRGGGVGGARGGAREPLHLLTNDLQRPAVEIARLYKERWRIELLFKWLKQNLKIRSFWGRSENAVRLQIYAALIAFMLLRILHQTAARAVTASTALGAI